MIRTAGQTHDGTGTPFSFAGLPPDTRLILVQHVKGLPPSRYWPGDPDSLRLIFRSDEHRLQFELDYIVPIGKSPLLKLAKVHDLDEED